MFVCLFVCFLEGNNCIVCEGCVFFFVVAAAVAVAVVVVTRFLSFLQRGPRQRHQWCLGGAQLAGAAPGAATGAGLPEADATAGLPLGGRVWMVFGGEQIELLDFLLVNWD